ncbi:MAG: hypothetical protein COB60_00565 [Flavobacteriaceae bacterium]|nr:MAG: hypothetical protein COB60_00565 [Flavobacteriaceae bacterium]
MKKLLAVFVFFGLVSCTISETPEFVGVEEVKFQKIDGEEVEIFIALKFLNPNSLGGTLKCDGLELIVNNLNVGVINAELFDVPSEKEFTVPLVATVPYNQLFKSDRKNMLKNILNVVFDQKINVKYTGNITYKLGILSYDYPLNYSDTISLKSKK